MPNLDEFLHKNDNSEVEYNNQLEKIEGVRPCSKCDLNVDGAVWDSQNLLLTWKCSAGHENSIQVG